MKKTFLGLAVIALIPALFAVFNSGNGDRIPADLRDAVADKSALGQLGYSENTQLPTPPQPQESRNAALTGASFTKGLKAPAPVPAVRSKQALTEEPSLAKLAAASGLSGQPPYEVLEGLFEKGLTATEKDLEGWHAGRTITTTDKGNFAASLIVLQRRPVNAGGGPLFEKEFVLEMLSKMYSGKPADYFDAMNDEALKAVRADVADDKGVPIAFPKAIAQVSGETGSAKLEYRKWGVYLLERWSTQETGKDWVVRSHAYFFKTVTPP